MKANLRVVRSAAPPARGEQPSPRDFFLDQLALLVGAPQFRHTKIEVFTSGPEFYERQLEAIHQAVHSVQLESYIFHDNRVGNMFLDACAERAKAGAKVRLLLDAAGNWHVPNSFFEPLKQAGGRVHFFRSFRLPRVLWLTFRNHRDLLIVDGRVAFIGGAGISDEWLFGESGMRPWKDYVLRLEGDAVALLEAVFCRCWFEQARELLLPTLAAIEEDCGESGGVVINSKPLPGGPSAAYISVEALLKNAAKEVNITTPYFVPPKRMLRVLCATARRGVRVRLLLPGENSDHTITRGVARARYGQLLGNGVEVYEYLPSMHHGKAMTIDGKWTIVGSVNLDFRSLLRNEELLVVCDDPRIAAEIDDRFMADLRSSKRIGRTDYRRRGLVDRIYGALGLVLQRHL